MMVRLRQTVGWPQPTGGQRGRRLPRQDFAMAGVGLLVRGVPDEPVGVLRPAVVARHMGIASPDLDRVSRRPVMTPILGSSPALKRALDRAARVAPTSASVLLRGESGTGKELFARYVHDHSGRHGAFVALNCAATPEALVESQLFGHKRGAFTGATDAQPGLVVAAEGGTLFLDEVGVLALPVQAKVLRVLQERTVVAVGEVRERRVDLRVVAASHRDLRQLVAEGRFREDLYHRLARFELTLPALRERGRDVVGKPTPQSSAMSAWGVPPSAMLWIFWRVMTSITGRASGGHPPATGDPEERPAGLNPPEFPDLDPPEFPDSTTPPERREPLGARHQGGAWEAHPSAERRGSPQGA
jgi:hypothetical protein